MTDLEKALLILLAITPAILIMLYNPVIPNNVFQLYWVTLYDLVYLSIIAGFLLGIIFEIEVSK